MAIRLNDVLVTSGDKMVLEMIRREYDVELNISQVNVDIEYVVAVAENGTDVDPTTVASGVDTWRKAVITPKPDQGFSGKSWFQYRPIPLNAFQFDVPFELQLDLPATPQKIIDQMGLRYGILLEVTDLGEQPDQVLWESNGEVGLKVCNLSKRFTGFWKFNFVSTDLGDESR